MLQCLNCGATWTEAEYQEYLEAGTATEGRCPYDNGQVVKAEAKPAHEWDGSWH